MTEAVSERLVIAGRELEVIRIASVRRGLPTLVFLHEGLGSAGLWRELPQTLAEKTCCAAIVYSRYGNGFSTLLAEARTPSYMHDEALVTLPDLLRQLDIDDVIFVGHSDGASIALIFAAEHPSVVHGAVLEAPHLFVEELSVRSIAAIKDEYESSDLRARMSKYHADVDRMFYGWNDIWLAPEFRDWNIESYASRVLAPLFAVQGRDDEYGTIAQIDALAQLGRGPVDRLMLARCGHSPHRDRSELVTEAMAAWINS